MKNIFIAGAGRSAGYLIRYLLQYSENHDLTITVGDADLENIRKITGNHPSAIPVTFDVTDPGQREKYINGADVVISLLPPPLHPLLIGDCIRLKKHFLNASYLTPEISSWDVKAREAGILMLLECGLDPGIDHLSAMEVFDRIRNAGGTLTSFSSYTGGLVAPESNDNPWGYKFSWNPRNVILAGQGTARYILDGHYRYIPYNRLFSEIETIEVVGLGRFDGYANRDSLSYRHLYGIENIPTLIRGTLRQRGFCRAWNVFVRLGLTDDSFVMENSASLTWSDLVHAFLPASAKGETLKEQLASFCNLPPDGEAMNLVEWTGVFEDIPTGLHNATPAMLLQKLLESKWILNPQDKDMIVMQHRFGYTLHGKAKQLTSTLVVKGQDQQHTAMAKTVGLPLAIAARLLLEGKMNLTGIHIPVRREIYEPLLAELATLGLRFEERETEG